MKNVVYSITLGVALLGFSFNSFAQMDLVKEITGEYFAIEYNTSGAKVISQAELVSMVVLRKDTPQLVGKSQSGTVIIMDDVLRIRVGNHNEKYQIIKIEKEDGENTLNKTTSYCVYKLTSTNGDEALLIVGNNGTYLRANNQTYMLGSKSPVR
jgi:hypothetical protein